MLASAFQHFRVTAAATTVCVTVLRSATEFSNTFKLEIYKSKFH